MGVTHEPLPLTQANWAESLQAYLAPAWRDITEGEWATQLKAGAWSTEGMRGCILHLYPFIHAFPKFLSLILLKAEDDYTRNFLIDNIRVEKAHADHWIWMGEGFGVSKAEMLAAAGGRVAPLRDVQSLSDWLWHVNTHGTMPEAMAATCFAIEGATGDMSRELQPHFEAYGNRPGIDMSQRTTRWLRNHAKYDDEHPKIALEIILRWARTDAERTRVMHAARRSLELLHLALLTGAQYGQRQGRQATGSLTAAIAAVERRNGDRRMALLPIAFPERRLSDRRARVH